MGCGPLQFVCDAAGGAAGQAMSSGFDAIARSFGEAAQTVCDWMWSAIATTTQVNLTGDWFRTDLGVTAALAGVLVAGLFVLQVVKGALRRDPHALGRAVTGCAVASLGAAAAVTVTGLLLALTDALSTGVVHLAGQQDVAAIGRQLTRVQVLTAGQFTPALVIALSILFVVASVLVWAVFLIRKALLIVAAVFAPVAFAGAAADGTRAWVRRWVEFTVAMVFAKLVIVLIFTVALSLLAGSGAGWNGLSNLMTGGLLLVLASFAPWMVFRLVHFVGGDVLAAHHSAVVADTKAVAGSATAWTSRAKGTAQKVLAGSATGGAAVPAAAAAAPLGTAIANGVPQAATPAPTHVGSATEAAVPGPVAGAPAVVGPQPVEQAPPRPRAHLSVVGADWSDAT